MRRGAKRARLTLSESLRRQLFPPAEQAAIELRTCPRTGAKVFAPAPHLPPLSTESVREMLTDFP